MARFRLEPKQTSPSTGLSLSESWIRFGFFGVQSSSDEGHVSGSHLTVGSLLVLVAGDLGRYEIESISGGGGSPSGNLNGLPPDVVWSLVDETG